MLSGFSNPLLIFLLLGLTVVLRLPSFHPNYTATDEAVYMAVAERMAQGHTLYTEAWDHKPPVLLLLYAGMYELFGTYTLWAVRVLATLLAFLAALLLNALYNRFRFSGRETSMPAFLLCLWLNVPWYTQELNAELLILLPALLIVKLMSDYFIDEQQQWSKLYWIGLLSGIIILTKYQGVMLILAFQVAYFGIASSRLRDLVTLGAGLFSCFFLLFVWMYVQGNLADFFRLAVMYNLDYMLWGHNPGEQSNWASSLEYLKIWGIPLLVAILSFLRMRSRYFSLAIRQRRFETIMALWLIGALLSILLGGSRMYLHYFILLLPPVTFYFVYFVHNHLPWLLRLTVPALALVVPLFTAASFAVVAQPDLYARVQPLAQKDGWLTSLRQSLQTEDEDTALRQRLQQQGVQDIWVAAFHPEYYTRLRLPCGSKYVNYNMARMRMSWLPENLKRKEPLCGTETLGDFYLNMLNEPPDAVLDPEGHFAEMRRKVLWLQHHYLPDTVGHMPLYFFRR